MRPEEIYALAVELSQEEIVGEGDCALSADDIYPVLLALEQRGVALRSTVSPIVSEVGAVASFIRIE